MRRYLPALFLQAWIFGFIAFFGAEVVLLEPTLRIVAQLLYGIPLLAWAALRLRRPFTRLDGAVAVCLGIYLVVCLTSRDLTGSLETLALVVCYAIFFWAMRRVAARPAIREVIVVGVATAMTFSLALNAWLMITEKITWIQVSGTLPRLEGLDVFPWETVNVMPVLVLISVPFLAWLRPGGVRRGLGAIIGLSALVVVPFSGGRTGYLAIAVAVCAWLLLSGTPQRLVRTWFPNRWRLVVALSAAAALLVASALSGLIVRGLGDSGRTTLWEQTTQLIFARPVTGNGPSTYSWAHLIYGSEAARLIAVRLTHNVFLQTLADGGVWLGGGMLLVVSAWIASVRSAFGCLTAQQRIAIAVLAGYATTLLLDDFSFLPSVIAMVVTIAAWTLPAPAKLAAAPPTSRLPNRLPSWLIPAVAGLLLVVAIPAVVAVDRARADAQRAREAAVSGDWQQAVAGFTAATTLHPANGGYWIDLGLARFKTGDLAGAREAYSTAARASPGDPRSYGALAALAPDEQAIPLLRLAAHQTLGDPQYHFRLGLALSTTGDRKGAAAAWGRAVTLDSWLFGVLPYGQSHIDRAAVVDAVEQAIEADPRADPSVDQITRWDVALNLDRLPGGAPAAWQAVAVANKGDLAAAAALAEQAVHESPDDPLSYDAAAFVAQLQCDDAAAASFFRIEAAAPGAYGGLAPAVAVRREFVYREAGLGAAQPLVKAGLPPLERWPSTLVSVRPHCGANG